MKGVNVKEMPTVSGIEKKEDFAALAKTQIPEAELLAKNGVCARRGGKAARGCCRHVTRCRPCAFERPLPLTHHRNN